MKKQYLWKSMKSGLRSAYDNSPWVIGEWRHVDPPDEMCIGLNASQRIIDAMTYVPCEILAKVEVGGEIIKGNDKWSCEKMRVVEAYKWTDEESVRLAVFSAELVIDLYEKQYPQDDRPRKAIQAARKWLEYLTSSKIVEAAWLSDAAGAAARAAALAAGAAWAAEAAALAAGAAAWAAEAAGKDEIGDQIDSYLLSRIEHLEKM